MCVVKIGIKVLCNLMVTGFVIKQNKMSTYVHVRTQKKNTLCTLIEYSGVYYVNFVFYFPIHFLLIFCGYIYTAKNYYDFLISLCIGIVLNLFCLSPKEIA